METTVEQTEIMSDMTTGRRRTPQRPSSARRITRPKTRTARPKTLRTRTLPRPRKRRR